MKRIWQNALPKGYLVAQLVAVGSKNPNQIVWPTAKDNDPKQKFKTEEFIAAVVKEVKSKHKIDETKVFALGWSSGGPPVYSSMLTKELAAERRVRGDVGIRVPRNCRRSAARSGRNIFCFNRPTIR